MEAGDDPTTTTADSQREEPPVWTYPTRLCRICLEDIPATVTMYPPGIPVQFQKPVVEYKNDDEYGRLIKPCHCRGSLRYIHELCLMRARTENSRTNSLWKCHECGHHFNFRKLKIQRLLTNKLTISAMTVMFMIFLVFMLGFVADPIINLYLDPYDTIRGRGSLFDELQLESVKDGGSVSPWAQHFTKGLISMGLVSFLKTVLLNPFHWFQYRTGGVWSSSSHRGTTGRDRAVNISWVAVMIGVLYAFWFFYKWMEAIVERQLQKLGNNIVDTQLPGDDDDLKPPAGWKPTATTAPASNSNEIQPDIVDEQAAKSRVDTPEPLSATVEEAKEDDAQFKSHSALPQMSGSWVDVDHSSGIDSDDPVAGVHRQGWSFSNL